MIKKIVKNSTYLLFAFCLILSNLYVPKASDKTFGQLKKELAQFEEDYNNNRLEKDLNEKEKAQIQANINAIQTKITNMIQEIDNLNREIEELQSQIIKDEQEIQDILAFTQIQNGESAYLEYAFGAKDFTDFIYRIAISEQMTSYNNELIETNKKNITDNKQKVQELATKKAQIVDEQTKLKIEMDKIKLTLSKLEEEVLDIGEQIKIAKNEIKMLEEGNCRDDETLDACNARILPSDTAFWRPLQVGYVSGWYGMRWHPIWNENRMHYGTDISNYGADNGTTKAYSVANGKVVAVFNNYNTCGGKKVYIKHVINGVVYTTGYWHLNAANVSEGQNVTRDTIIGTLAGRPDPTYGNIDRCSNGGHLHLEMSTGDWLSNTFESRRIDAKLYINFPTSTYKSWSNRSSKV